MKYRGVFMSSKCIRDTVNKVKMKYQESDPFRLAVAMKIIVKRIPLGTASNCCKGFCMRESRKTCIVINCDLPEIIQQIILIKCSQFPSCVDFTGFNCIQNCVYCYYLSFFSKIALKHRPHYFHI